MGTRLVLPVSFGNPGAFEPKTRRCNAITQAACSSSGATSIACWGQLDNDPTDEGGEGGVALGFDDGTVYLFRTTLVEERSSSRSSLAQNSISLKTELFTPGHSRESSKSILSFRSVSPSLTKINHNALTVPRPRAVSGLVKEQVEAARNQVDSEDGQGKLRGLLNDQLSRDRTPSDNHRSVSDKGNNGEKRLLAKLRVSSGSSERLPKSKDDVPTPLSGGASPVLSPTTPSPPPGTFRVKKILTLFAHVFPFNFGGDHAITSIKVLDDGKALLCLQKSGSLFVLSIQDGLTAAFSNIHYPPYPAAGSSSRVPSVTHVLWSWDDLQLVNMQDSIAVMACATPISSGSRFDEEIEDVSRCCLFELRGLSELHFGETRLEKIGDFVLDIPSSNISLCKDSDGHTVLLTLSDSKVSLQSIQLVIPNKDSNPTSPTTPDLLRTFQNPLKALKKRFNNSSTSTGPSKSCMFSELGAKIEMGQFNLKRPLCGVASHQYNGSILGAIWSTSEIQVFVYSKTSFSVRSLQTSNNIQRLTWADPTSFVAVHEGHIDQYALRDKKVPSSVFRREKSGITPVGDKLTCVTPTSQVITSSLNRKSRRSLDLVKLLHVGGPDDCAGSVPQNLWTAGFTPRVEKQQRHITSVLPLELTWFVMGFSDGSIQRTRLQDVVQPTGPALNSLSPAKSLNGRVIFLSMVLNKKTFSRLIVGGGDDGSLAFWDLKTLQLLARWVVYTCPLSEVVHFDAGAAERSRDNVYCISEDGTIAAIAMDSLELLYVIPGAAAPLTRVCEREDDLLLVYTDDRARLWNLKTGEFWRSTDADKVHEMLEKDQWMEATIGESESLFNQWGLAVHPHSGDLLDSASTVLFDLTTVIGYATQSKADKPSDWELAPVRSLLAALHTPGIDTTVDSYMTLQLGIPSSDSVVGFADQNFTTTLLCYSSPTEVWQQSPESSAVRLIALVALLRCFLNFTEYEVAAGAAVAFYTTSLPEAVGTKYQSPSLPSLAYWSLEPLVEVRGAAQMLFETEVARQPDEVILSIVEKWRVRLPCLVMESEQQSSVAALALHFCGYIASQKYTLLPPSTLTEISKSITMYLYDESSPHRYLAIDLCTRGFQVWQHYFDAIPVLRSLVTLATSSKKEVISLRNVGPQARLAILQLVSSNTALFMTTLSLDILQPRSVEYSKSVMQLLAYLIRKKPLVLSSNLPRLLESVVKSLDANSNSAREAILDAATEILGLVVRTYPTVDFHMESQRLAVGTSEGAAIMYDLKTGTRLYVLEGHKKRVAAISFSPDGRRLVTVSLDESVVLVWKVGASLSNFFYPGAPPRQGGSGGTGSPYKSLNFNVGEEVNMTIAASLEWVQFEWTANRSVKLKIRESTLTFST